MEYAATSLKRAKAGDLSLANGWKVDLSTDSLQITITISVNMDKNTDVITADTMATGS
jgi:hypothetical protein